VFFPTVSTKDLIIRGVLEPLIEVKFIRVSSLYSFSSPTSSSIGRGPVL